jgi:hypothetical protein
MEESFKTSTKTLLKNTKEEDPMNGEHPRLLKIK